ncbi:hypothetical protein [Spiroplasma monobiae]|uniref:HTH rpiR-type domain-containing protein n=1 Tax=Spiroplasma monobiae MQ-1 TaxID=1336748 RepID=A0A2K9LUJ2_SPISQ|nr:hypothetical protein [Spiroplasma monobiae]AUM62716.1 hypothetical protein SMONO_v1c04670 [Spiroplasma monobiae MQ-1]
MKTIYIRIDNLGKENRNTVFKIIARQILEDFSKGIFLTQNELAHKCHCSKSTITAFSKAALVSGFRELQMRLRIEYENNFKINNTIDLLNKNNEQNFFEINDNLKNWVNSNDKQIEFFIKKIISKKVNVFSCYQTVYSTIFLEDVLNKNNIDNKVINLEKDVEIIRKLNYKDSYNVFIFSGRDNSFLTKLFEYIYNDNKDIIVFVSLNWKDYFKDKDITVIYFDNEKFERNFIDRNFKLIYMWKYIDYILTSKMN